MGLCSLGLIVHHNLGDPKLFTGDFALDGFEDVSNGNLKLF